MSCSRVDVPNPLRKEALMKQEKNSRGARMMTWSGGGSSAERPRSKEGGADSSRREAEMQGMGRWAGGVAAAGVRPPLIASILPGETRYVRLLRLPK